MHNKRAIGCLLAMLLTCASWAQLPSAARIEQEQHRIDTQSKALFDTNRPTSRNAPHPFPNVRTPPRASIDIDAIARQYAQKAAPHARYTLMIFASFTMPKTSLKRLLRQTYRVGAPVLLRGFKDNSLKQTALAIKALGKPNAQVLIHPEAFTHYHIRAVPTVVLIQDRPIDAMNDPARALSNDFVSIAGDVSLDYALDEIARRAPKFGPAAARSLRQLRGKSQ